MDEGKEGYCRHVPNTDRYLDGPALAVGATSTYKDEDGGGSKHQQEKSENNDDGGAAASELENVES